MTEQTESTTSTTNNEAANVEKIYDGVTAYPVNIDFRKRRPLLDAEGKYITEGITDKDDTLEVTISGNKTIVKAERIPAFIANLPIIDGKFIVNTISSLWSDSQSEELEESARKDAEIQLAKFLEYFAEYHNSAITVLANKQLNDKLKSNILHKFNQADITLSELYIWELVNKEPVDRKQFSDELIAAAKADFISVIPQFATNKHGTKVSNEGAANVAAVIFDKKNFEKFKTNKDGLATFQQYAGVWFINTSQDNQDTFTDYFNWLNSRIDTWLSIDNTAILAKFE